MKVALTRRSFLASAAVSIVPSAMAVAQPKSLIGMLLSAQETAKSEKNVTPGWKDEGVIDLTDSPYAKLKTVPVWAVVVKDGFWSQRRKATFSSSIPSMNDELLADGRLDNLFASRGQVL